MNSPDAGKAGQFLNLLKERLQECRLNLGDDAVRCFNSMLLELNIRSGKDQRTPWMLRAPDFKNDGKGLKQFAKKLKACEGAVSSYLHSRLKDGVSVALRAWETSSPVPQNLIAAINTIIIEASIFDGERFEGVPLRPATQELRNNQPTGDAVVKLNRFLLADAYPDDIETEPSKPRTQPITKANLKLIAEAVWKLKTRHESLAPAAKERHFWPDFHDNLKKQLQAPQTWCGEKEWLNFVLSLFSNPDAGNPPPGLSLKTPAALELYRRHIISQFRDISLSGFGGDGAESEAEGKAELANVYVDLDVRIHPPPIEYFHGVSPLDDGLHPILQWLAADPRRVLIGLPSSGKSTILKFFSLCLAQCGLKPDAAWLDHLKLWPKGETDLIPIFVELRQFAASLPAKLPAVDGGQHLTNYILAQLKPSPLEECAAALKTTLVVGRAIVFLDGLDEVPDDDLLRRFVLDTVEAFALGPFKESRIIVTCRPRSYDDPAWQLRGFETAEVAGLDQRKIERFIEQFYSEAARHNARLAEVKTDRIAKLKRAVRREELQELAANPFMLTVMAWLHRSEELPKKRALILSRLVEQLLLKWEENKYRDAREEQVPSLSKLLKQHNLDDTSVRRVLCRLAFQARQADQPDGDRRRKSAVHISKTKVLAALKELPDANNVSENQREKWALQVIQVIDRRTGLLVPEGGDWFIMPYKLEEFLAGEHLTDADELDTLAGQLKLPDNKCSFECVVAELIGANGYWEEVVKWAAATQAHAGSGRNKGKARDLALELSELHVPSNAVAVRRAVVAGEILWEIGVNEVRNTHHKKGPECLKRVRETLDEMMHRQSLIPMQRAAAGVARGWLEELPPGVGVKRGITTDVPDIAWCGLNGNLADRDSTLWKDFAIHAKKFKIGGDPKAHGCSRELRDCRFIRTPFLISKYPVTVAQYQLFVKSDGYMRGEFWTDAGNVWRTEGEEGINRRPEQFPEYIEWALGKVCNEGSFPAVGPRDFDAIFHTPNHPVVGISFLEAVAYCNWVNTSAEIKRALGLPSGYNVRLPSEAEWELASRGPKADRDYPWGSEGSEVRCNSYGIIGTTSAVGMFPEGDAAFCGASDMAGNVWEWCSTVWAEKEEYAASENIDVKGAHNRTIRGGSWFDALGYARCAARKPCGPWIRFSNIGFRVVASKT